MSSSSYTDEMERVLSRPDADELARQIDAYRVWNAGGNCKREWPSQFADDFTEIISCYRDDPDKALAYVILAVQRTDDGLFLAMMGAGPLEDVLRDPSDIMLERIVAEARKSARFRWLLSFPYKVAIAERAWLAIEKFRMTGPHEEPPPESLPG